MAKRDNYRTQRGQQDRRKDVGFCRDAAGRFDTCEGGVGKAAHTAALNFFNEWEGEKYVCRDSDGSKRKHKKGGSTKGCSIRRPYTARDWPWGDEREPGGKDAQPLLSAQKKLAKRIAAWLKKNPGKEAVDYTGKILRPSQMAEIFARRAGGGAVPPLARLMGSKKGEDGDYYVRRKASVKARRAAGAKKGAKTRKRNAPKKIAIWSMKKVGANYVLTKGKNTQTIKPLKYGKKGSKYAGRITSGPYKGETNYARAKGMMEAKNAKLTGKGSANRGGSCSCW